MPGGPDGPAPGAAKRALELRGGRGPRAFVFGGIALGCAVNGFHVDAVGWVLTVNARALSRQEARELSNLWIELMHTRTQDFRGAPFLYRLLFPRSTRLSDKTMTAFAALVERMAALHPERFGGDALRRRRDHWLFQAALGFLLGTLAATFLSLAWPLAREAVLTLFLMGLGFLIPMITLWRAAAAVRYFSVNEHWKWHLLHRHSNPFLHR